MTNGINCISCFGWSNAGCNDPYNEATSGDRPVPGNTYCLVYNNFYIEFYHLFFFNSLESGLSKLYRTYD
jgi:hypothetical protein